MSDATLATEARLRDPDAFYARLIELHDGLDQDAANRLNATLILIMANQIGDDELLHRILDKAAATWAGPDS